MSYGDFFIRYEYTFLKNIYTKDELRSAPQIRTLGDYYKTFQKFIKICTALQEKFISHVDFSDIDEFDPELKEFIQTKCNSTTLKEIQNDIENTEIENIIKNTSYKIPRFNLKLYAFVYNKFLEFPKSDITYDTTTTNNFSVFIYFSY